MVTLLAVSESATFGGGSWEDSAGPAVSHFVFFFTSKETKKGRLRGTLEKVEPLTKNFEFAQPPYLTNNIDIKIFI